MSVNAENLAAENAGAGADKITASYVLPQGPFVLSGPTAKLDEARIPVRGDLAHIALAGVHFVPNYAVPQPRIVNVGGAQLRKSRSVDAEALCSLNEGDNFDLLEIVGSWAWGCISLEGPVGYIHIDQLKPAG